MRSNRHKGGLEVFTDSEELTIRIGVGTLARAIEFYKSHEGLNVDDGAFAESMVSALLDEQEDGYTAVHELFERAADWCLEQGMEGFGCDCGEWECGFPDCRTPLPFPKGPTVRAGCPHTSETCPYPYCTHNGELA